MYESGKELVLASTPTRGNALPSELYELFIFTYVIQLPELYRFQKITGLISC